MFGVIVALVIAAIGFGYFKRSKAKHVKEENEERYESTSSIHVLRIDETEIPEEFPTKSNEILVYMDEMIHEHSELFQHTMEFVGTYIYPKKEFRRISIEEKNIVEKPAVLIHTDSDEMYFLTFNENFRVIALKKKISQEPFANHTCNKIKQHFFVEEKEVI